MSNKSFNSALASMTLVVMFAVLVGPRFSLAGDHPGKKSAQTPVGAWFGIAVPCAAGNTSDPEICIKACGFATCPQLAGILPPEVTMMPTLNADNTILADDFAEIIQYHTPSHGSWELTGSTTTHSQNVNEYEATFIWLQSQKPTNPLNPLTAFQGSIRDRFVFFFDDDHPNVMEGYVQPYVYNYVNATTGLLNRDAQGFPSPDPVAALPTTCDPATPTVDGILCLGTYQFKVRRITVK